MRLKFCFMGTVQDVGEKARLELGPEAIETVKESISSLIQVQSTLGSRRNVDSHRIYSQLTVFDFSGFDKARRAEGIFKIRAVHITA